MKLSNELSAKAKTCKSAEEIAALAKQHGIELSEKEAQAAFAHLNKCGELSDEELNAVAAGGDGCKSQSGDTPLFAVGEKAMCDGNEVTILEVSAEKEGWSYKEWHYAYSRTFAGRPAKGWAWEHELTKI